MSLIGVRNQRKFAPNPSPIRIRITACAHISILSITFGSDIQLRSFNLRRKVKLKGYNFVVYQKSNLGLFKSPLGQNSRGRAAIELNLGFLKVSSQFLEFYLCYGLLEALLR